MQNVGPAGDQSTKSGREDGKRWRVEVRGVRGETGANTSTPMAQLQPVVLPTRAVLIPEEQARPLEESTATTRVEAGQGEPRQKCPKCGKVIRRVGNPVICSTCKRRYHLKFTGGTRGAVERMREARAWKCRQCEEEALHSEEPEVRAEAVGAGEVEASGLRFLQWNYDFLAMKREELEELLRRRKIDMAALQETKLGRDDRMPVVEGYCSVRRDRPGIGTTRARGGGLPFYVRRGLALWHFFLQTEKVESACLHIPLAKRSRLTIVNVYIPLYRGEGAAE